MASDLLKSLGSEKPKLIVRESFVSKVFWFVLFLAILLTFLYFAQLKEFPLPIIIFSSTGILFILAIQFHLVVKASSSNNWLLKFYSEGVLVKTSGYLSDRADGENIQVFIPKYSIEKGNLERQSRQLAKLKNGRRSLEVQSFLFLVLEVNKSEVKELRDEPRKKQKSNMSAKYLFTPVTESEKAYRIELRSHRSRTTPSIRSILKFIKKWGVHLKQDEKTEFRSYVKDESIFKSELRSLIDQGFEKDAIEILRNRYNLGIKEAREKLNDFKSMLDTN